MYLSILKRDLKRKKTMNTILLIFMIMSVMFVSSSINTMTSVMSSVDKFLDVSGAKDYFVATIGTSSEQELNKRLDSLSSVRSVKSENILYLNGNSVRYNGVTLEMSSNGILNSIDDIGIKVYDGSKNELTSVNDGDIYMKSSFLEKNNVPLGSKVTIRIGGYSGEFTVRGVVLDVLFGSDMMGTPRFVISRNDFDKIAKANTDPKYDMYKGVIYNIETDDTASVEKAVSGIDGVAFTASRDIIKMTYIMDMIVAGIFLIVSVCLIIIAIVLLRFTIGFTVSEEYREIGVMKAIGIKNSKIRTLYMIKYIAMALVGAVIGFFAGIPFGNMLTEQSSKQFVTGESGSLTINLICAAAVLLIIALFTWFSTRKVRKFTPVDAIRNGESGKRYKKKGLLRLSKSRQTPVFFMALNDILSGFRHFAIMTVTFVVGILMIAMMLNTITTLKSPKLLSWFSMADCDLTLEDKNCVDKYTQTDGRKKLASYLKEIEKTLAENHIPAKCFSEIIFKFPIQKGENSTVSLAFIGTGTTADMYAYIEGTPPQNEKEIAVSHIIADKIGAEIGDTVTIRIDGENKKFIITGLTQSMNNMGESIRFHESFEPDFSNALGYFSYQILYTDNPSGSELQSRYDTVKALFPDYTLRTAGEYMDYAIGGIAGILDDVKTFVVIVVMLINILVVILMEKSFLTKERGEIALLKAVGFKNRSLIAWQVIRVSVLMAAAVIIAILLAEPVSQLAVGGIFKMMGSKYIVFDINILESYILYPLAVFAVTVLTAMMSAFGIRNISSQEVNNIE